MTRRRSGALLVWIVLGLASALGVTALALSWSAASGYALSHLDAARVRLDAAHDSLGEAASSWRATPPPTACSRSTTS